MAEEKKEKTERKMFGNAGIEYFEDGKVYRAGVFQPAGLLWGMEFYKSGMLRFIGKYADKSVEHYYGPAAPREGRYFLEDGTLLYNGRVKLVFRGSLSYPSIAGPDGYIPVDLYSFYKEPRKLTPSELKEEDARELYREEDFRREALEALKERLEGQAPEEVERYLASEEVLKHIKYCYESAIERFLKGEIKAPALRWGCISSCVECLDLMF